MTAFQSISKWKLKGYGDIRTMNCIPCDNIVFIGCETSFFMLKCQDQIKNGSPFVNISF